MRDESGRSFASDNNSGIHPEVLEAITRANQGHVVAYGDDPFTKSATALFKREFGSEAEVHFVFNGTGANVLGLQAMTRPHNAVICSEHSHIHQDECGAPERFTGCKLIPVPAPLGKLSPDAVQKAIRGVGNQHSVQPKVISISQSTEVGTVYRVEELLALARVARENGMFLHMDGARISNAAASLGISLKGACTGADILSFGGTKNGLLVGEAVVILNPELKTAFEFTRKQGMQLASKMRFVSVQFEALLSNELWLRNAKHSNGMAKLLAEQLGAFPEIQIMQPVEANGIFVRIPPELIKPLQKKFFFHVWDAERSVVRWMASFDTTESDVSTFVSNLRELLGK